MTAPITVSPAVGYRDGLAEGRLLFQRCTSCHAAIFYPRVLCPACGSSDPQWEQSAGAGTVYSTTTVRSRSGDYNVALIDLDEGFRMMCTVAVDEGAAAVEIGERVLARVPVGTTPETLAFERAAGTPVDPEIRR